MLEIVLALVIETESIFFLRKEGTGNYKCVCIDMKMKLIGIEGNRNINNVEILILMYNEVRFEFASCATVCD